MIVFACLVVISVGVSHCSASCCGDARVYVADYAGTQMRSVNDSRLLETGSDEELLLDKLLEVHKAAALFAESESDVAYNFSGGADYSSKGTVKSAPQDAACVSERAKLVDWEYPETGSFWAVQDGFSEHEFTRFVVDTLLVGQLDYWNTGSGVVPTIQRVVVLRVNAAPNFLPTWESADAAMPTVICEESSLALNILREALKDYSGWFVVLVPSHHKESWDAWLARHFDSLGGIPCNASCLVGVAEDTGVLWEDVQAGLDTIPYPADNPFASCEACKYETTTTTTTFTSTSTTTSTTMTIGTAEGNGGSDPSVTTSSAAEKRTSGGYFAGFNVVLRAMLCFGLII